MKGLVSRVVVSAILTVALTCSSFAVLPTNTARAEDPMVLENQITDPAKILGDSLTEVQDSVSQVKSVTGLNLWILYVGSFDGEKTDIDGDGKIDTNDWVKDVANRSKLGENDVVLAVATTRHELVIYVSANNKYLKKRNIDQITNATMVQLRSGDWGKAALTFCETVEKQIDNRSNIFAYIIAGLVIFGLIGFLAWSSNNRGLSPEEIQAKNEMKREQRRLHKRRKVLRKSSENMLAAVDSDFAPASSMQEMSEMMYPEGALPPEFAGDGYYAQSSSDPYSPNPQYPTSETVDNFVQPQNYPSLDFSDYSRPVVPQPEVYDQGAFNQAHDDIIRAGYASNNYSAVYGDGEQLTSRQRLDSLYGKYGAPESQTPGFAPADSTKELYGDYYSTSSSREIYGSYYNEGKAKRHDEALNYGQPNSYSKPTFSKTTNLDMYNQYLDPTLSQAASSNGTDEIYSSYYDEQKSGFLDRFK